MSAHLILNGISLPKNRWRIDLSQKQMNDMLVQTLAWVFSSGPFIPFKQLCSICKINTLGHCHLGN